MRFYSGDGKRVAKTESGKNREKPAVRSREYIPEAEGKEKRETIGKMQAYLETFDHLYDNPY